MKTKQGEARNKGDGRLHGLKGLMGARMRQLKISAFLGILAMAAVAFPIRTQAAATLSLFDGVNPLITVVDNGPGDMFGATGAILVRTNVGVWQLSISSAVTKPLFGSATDPVMDLGITASSVSAGSLTIVFSDNGFGPSTGILHAIVDGQNTGAPATVTYDVYGDPANVVGATTIHIASIGTSPLPVTATGSGPLTLPTPFSLTQIDRFDATGATTINSDASFNVTPVPEPTGMALAVLGLAAFALGSLHRKRA